MLLGGELGGVVEGVHGGGVSQVSLQVGNGALASHNGLHEEAKHGKHGQAAVLDLLHLELSKGVRVVSQANGIEEVSSRVELVQAFTQGAAIHPVALNEAHEDNLGGGDGQDGLGVDQVGVAQVVQATVGKDLGAGLPPDGLGNVSTCTNSREV